MKHLSALSGSVALAAAALTALPGAAFAGDPAPIHTVVTSPSDGTAVGSAGSFAVTGQAYNVDKIEIVCVAEVAGTATALLTLDDVTVAADRSFKGVFSQVPSVPCRLRAVPEGTTVASGYLGSFSGPVIYPYFTSTGKDGEGHLNSFVVITGAGDGKTALSSAGDCGIADLETVQRPALRTDGSLTDCALDLGQDGAVSVDHQAAYLPTTAYNDFGQLQGAGAIAFSTRRATNGDTTVTESEALTRCTTASSCGTLVPTGVTYSRTYVFGADGHQVSVRDVFASNDGRAHNVALSYQTLVTSDRAGYVVPRHSNGFVPAPASTTWTGFGTGSGTVLIRSDRFAGSQDPAASTLGLTWSRPPASVTFNPVRKAVRPNTLDDNDELDLNYGLSVPAHGRAGIGLALSEGVATSSVQSLAASARAAMINAPVVTTPHQGARVRARFVVVGTLPFGANGVPIGVTVGGRRATLTATSATTARYRATLHIPGRGRHTVRVVATDVAGNTAVRTLMVKRR